MTSWLHTVEGERARMGPMPIRRVLPNHVVDLGAFVFLDHLGPHRVAPGEPARGTGPHPHRGFPTLTYVLDGEVEHRDSAGHRGVVGAGGAQWMFAGRGIVHDERPSEPFRARGGPMEALQLWVDAPAAHKEDAPAYRALAPVELPEHALPGGGRARVVVGRAFGLVSPVPSLSPVLALHLRWPAGVVAIETGLARCGVYVLAGALRDGRGRTANTGTLVVLEPPEGALELEGEEVDALLLASAPFDEPRVMQGPFVMSDRAGIERAYEGYLRGEYGRIT